MTMTKSKYVNLIRVKLLYWIENWYKATQTHTKSENCDHTIRRKSTKFSTIKEFQMMGTHSTKDTKWLRNDVVNNSEKKRKKKMRIRIIIDWLCAAISSSFHHFDRIYSKRCDLVCSRSLRSPIRHVQIMYAVCAFALPLPCRLCMCL